MDKEAEKLINENVSKDFKKLVNGLYLNKLEKIMSVCSDTEAMYVLNVTLKVLHNKFK